jgi:hypothetical protein
MNDIFSSSESYDISAVNEAANNLQSHADTALGLSRAYTVSPKLQDAKSNFEASLEAFSTAANMHQMVQRSHIRTQMRQERFRDCHPIS